MSRGRQPDIRDWEQHLYHLICHVWADKRCRVCAIKDHGRGRPEQWKIPHTQIFEAPPAAHA